MGQEKGTVMQTSPSYLSISLEVIVSGRALTPRSIVVRSICNSWDWLSFNISIGNLQRKGFGPRVIFVRYMFNSESCPEFHLYISRERQFSPAEAYPKI